ncbi:cytosolic regulator pianissimo [Stemphylium lycopersici]|nr:cytosolic regulator pianissimo [Stemphylium lycopersici]
MASSRGGQASYASYATANTGPGSFNTALMRPPTAQEGRLRPDFDMHAITIGDNDGTTTEQRQAELQDQIEKETKIKIGSENLLEALNAKNAKESKNQRLQVEEQLNISNRKLAQLQSGLAAEKQRAKEVKSPPADPQSRLSYLFRRNLSRSPSRHVTQKEEDEAEETESPTFVLAEILQALEVQGMQPEYYVERANSLVLLFKRHSTLKYDLAWSIFGLRMQTMLLSDSREVVAAAYRVMRYSFTDRKSLRIIRALHTDHLVILSLVKESKASVEREQALKFVRAFLDVKGGVEEIARAVVRIIVAVAEHAEDRLRNIATLTLAEILVRKPSLLVAAGGMGALADALGEGSYHAAESVSTSFLYLLDTPRRRRFLRSGRELEAPFAMFTDASTIHGHLHEEKLKVNAKVIASMLRSWAGLLTLSMNDFLPLRSLLWSLQIPTPHVRNIILELLFDLLRIKPPSWSSSFLAGRRLTTYGRVTNLKNQQIKDTSTSSSTEDDTTKWSLLDHYVSVILAAFLHAGLMPALLQAEEESLTLPLKRKTTLLIGEVLKMANELLPPSWSAQLQVLPQLLHSAAKFQSEDRFIAIGTIYQVDSINRTLYRSDPNSLYNSKGSSTFDDTSTNRQSDQAAKLQAAMQVDEAHFRNLMVETQVLNTVTFQKWRWDLILNIIEGPLLNPKRLDEAIKVTKFIHRVLGFYRPFKYRFSEIKNTKPNQRYVRAGCALMESLLQNPEGVKYLAESKFIRQLAECLSHFDRMSGLTSESPIFQTDRMNETLTGGYFALLGALTKDSRGIHILERWRVINMFYHIIELNDRDDLIRTLLSNMDYTLDGHLRIIISKAMTSCSKEIRIFATRLLRKYATKPMGATSSDGVAEWAIRLLVTQLYDPDVEVCEVAIKILEEACNQKDSLEFVVKCRPALDHLGEIGAPLLLRFLSTSVGYHYLDGLDYITREMDDWFLGRNDTYVALIEASMARALADIPEKPSAQLTYDDAPEPTDYGLVPPHFYRELTRTKEGCKLLKQKGHFDEFAATIRDFASEHDDPEIILKVKGCLWAVGNVGSMELGAPFLENSDVVKWVVQIAEQSEVMSLRGTAFYVLGLISRSLHGQEILLEYGWDGVVNDSGEALGFCLPLDFNRLFTMTPWVARAEDMSWNPNAEIKVAVTDNDPVNARILKLATDLGNTVLAKKAASDLQAIKARKAPGFSKPAIFHKVMQILEAHHFRLPACRFILDLFDKRVLEQIVLEEEDDQEDESSIPVSVCPTNSLRRERDPIHKDPPTVYGCRSHCTASRIYMNRQRTKGCSIVDSVEHSFEPQLSAQALMCDNERQTVASEAVALDAHRDARQLVRLVQCPRCSKTLSTPVTLPCGHTVCRDCLPSPQPRTNISYPNTPDRLMGIACPLLGCGAEHASAECSVDVTLAKLMDLIKAEIVEHRSTAEDTPTLLVELPQLEDLPMDEKEKEKATHEGHQQELHGGCLLSTFTMAELGELRYTSEVRYQSLSASGDNYKHLDIALLERLREVTHKELDCLVCYNLMLDPTTTSCGHTFCRRCLARVMDHSSICPFCRRGLHVPASLQNQSSNAILNSLLNGLCPDLVNARADALKAEEQAGDNVLNVPLFICTLSLPSMPTFLHVFEPRYRLMMRRVIEGNKQFGMVMYNRTRAAQGELGSTSFLEYGTLLEIVNYELLRDGRSFIETRGIGRFKVRAHGMLDGYNVGRIERVEDVSLAEEAILEQRETTMARDYAEAFFRDHPQTQLPTEIAIETLSTQQLLESCTAFVREMREASAPWLRERIIQVYGEPPEDPAIFPYWFASVVPIVEEEKYVLLQTERVRERLKIVYSWIGRIRGQRWQCMQHPMTLYHSRHHRHRVSVNTSL